MTDVTWNPAGDDDTSFGPLTAHNVLGGRTAADAHPAAAVSYDNDVSGLTGDTVQEAIDELATSGGAVASVNGETGVVVLDAGDVGAVPTARTITAGTGLTGGGDLSADRTLTVTYGATAGTAAEGNDARITGAVQSSLVDAAGDLLVGTGDNAVGRLATTAFGRARLADNDAAAAREALELGSDSATAHLAVPPPAAVLAFSSNEYLHGPTHAPVAASVEAWLVIVGRETFVPFFCPAGTYDAIGVHTTVAGATTWRLGVDAFTPTGPGAVLLDAGTVDLSAAAGWQIISGLAFVVPSARWVWGHIKCVASTSAPTVSTLNGIYTAASAPNVAGWPSRGTLPGRSTVAAASSMNTGSAGPLTAPTGPLGHLSGVNVGVSQTAPVIALRRSA